MRRLVSLLCLCALAGALCGVSRPAVADVAYRSLDQAVEGKPDTTYLDLVRLIVPGLTPHDGVYRARALKPLRHVSGERDRQKEAPSGATFGSVAVLPVQSGGRNRLLVLIDLGSSAEGPEGYAILALFDMAARRPHLLDAVDAAYDRDTAFLEPGKLAVGAGEDIVLTASRHSNSNQAYQTTTLIGLRGDRIRLIDSVFTFNDGACGFERRQTPNFAALDPGLPQAIRATVTEEVTLTEEECGDEALPAEGRRSISVTYRWQVATRRYVRDSDALDRLARETAERF